MPARLDLQYIATAPREDGGDLIIISDEVQQRMMYSLSVINLDCSLVRVG